MSGPKKLGSDFGRTDSRGFSLSSHRIFGVFSSFLWAKSAQINSSRKIPDKSSKTTSTKIPDNFLQRDRAKKNVLSPQENLAICLCDGKSLAIVFFALFHGRKGPRCGLVGDGDLCDRKSRRFAIAIFGALIKWVL